MTSEKMIIEPLKDIKTNFLLAIKSSQMNSYMLRIQKISRVPVLGWPLKKKKKNLPNILENTGDMQ